MAFNARVGRAILELTTDSVSYDAAIAKARANAKALGGDWKQTAADLKAFTANYQGAARQVAALTNEFLGDKQIAQANHLITAIRNVGGVEKLTASERARANATLTEAIQKYQALGQQAPKAMLETAAATRQAVQPTSILTTSMVALGSAIGTFAANLAQQALRSLVQFGREAFTTSSQLVDLRNKTGESLESLQRMQFVASQTGTSLEAMSNAAFMLRTRLAGGGGSVVAALDEVRKASGDMSLSTRSSADQILTALSRIQDEQERLRLGTALFGRGYRELAAAVTEGYAEIAKGASISTDAQIEALDDAGDAWDRWWANRKANIRSFLGELVMLPDAIARMGAPDELGLGPGSVGPTPPRNAYTIETKTREIPKTYVQQLAEMQAALAKLTQAERDEIAAARELGVSTEELEAKYDLAEGSLRLLNAQTTAYQKTLNSTAAEAKALRDSLFGQDVIRRANAMVVAIGDVGNVSRLSVERQREVHQVVTEAIEAYVRLGQTAPQSLRDLAEATAELVTNTANFSEAYQAIPAVIESAASSIEGRMLPAVTGLSAALENARQKAAALKELQDEGFLNGPAVITNEDASGEAREISRRQLDKQLQEQRDHMVAFWKRQGSAFKDASLGRLGSLMFGQIGHDVTGELRAAADEAHQEFLKLQRSGKATAEELELAFKRWREAEERANLTFGERWKQFWGGLKQTFVNVLNEMLQEFVGNFLKGMLKGLMESQLGQKLGELFGGGRNGQGSPFSNVAQNALPGLIPGMPNGGPPGSPGPGAPGVGQMAGAFAAIDGTRRLMRARSAGGSVFGGAEAGAGVGYLVGGPWGALIGAGIGAATGALTWTFRGGWEGVVGNKRRDQFFGQLQARYGGTQYEAAVKSLASAKVTGAPASKLISDVYDADNEKKFESAQAAFLSALERGGVKGMRAFRVGTPGLDFQNFGRETPALLHGEEAVIPKGSGNRLAAEIAKGLAAIRIPRPTSTIIGGDTSQTFRAFITAHTSAMSSLVSKAAGGGLFGIFGSKRHARDEGSGGVLRQLLDAMDARREVDRPPRRIGTLGDMVSRVDRSPSRLLQPVNAATATAPTTVTPASSSKGPTHILVEVNTTIEGARGIDDIRKEFHEHIIPEFKFALTHHTDGLVPAIKAVR